MQGIDQCRNICTIDVEVIEVIILFQNDSISAKGNCQIVSAAREVSRCNIQTRKLNGIISSSIPDGIYTISSLEDDGIITVIILNEIISGTAVDHIISASGMCDAGRIRHHLKYNLWRADSAVVFVGFQSPGTLGRTLLDGTPSVKLFGEDVAVRAKVVNFQGLSSHADHDHLLDWIGHFKEPKPQHVFVVHGDREVAPVFAQTVSQLGFTAHAPQYTEEYDLIADKQLSPGYLPERRTRAYEGAPKITGAYQRLVQLGDMLVGLIRRSKGRDNKTLAAFAEAISKLISKFEF